MFNDKGDSIQPERTPKCGAMSVQRGFSDDEVITITCTHDGQETHVVMSEFNAWRVFGTLALILGIKLSSKIAKGIKF